MLKTSITFSRVLEKVFQLKLKPTIKSNYSRKTASDSISAKLQRKKIEEILPRNQPKYCLDCYSLNYIFLWRISDPLATCVEQLFTRCIIKCYLPDALKISKVLPLHKEGDKHELTNYRPIPLLPTIGKIFEKLIYNRLVQFLDRYHILSEKQFGFWKKRSTVDANATLVGTIRQLWKNRTKVSCCTILDLKKASHTADHKLLLQRCHCYGFRKETYKLIESFLIKRKQHIQIGTKKSSLQLVQAGVAKDLYWDQFCSSFIMMTSYQCRVNQI